MRSDSYEAVGVHEFLAGVADADGHPPLSEHKVTTLGRHRNLVGVWSDDAGQINWRELSFDRRGEVVGISEEQFELPKSQEK